MKRLVGTLLVLALALAGCASPQGTERDEIAALEEGEDSKETPKDGDEGKADPKDGAGTKKKPPRKGGDGGSNAGGGGSSANGDGGNGGGGGSQPSASGGGGGSTSQAAAAPIPAGEYEYATDGERTVSGNSEQLPDVTTLTAGAPANGVQRQTRDLRDSEGNGILTETDLLYRDGDVFLSYVKITARFQGGLTDVREFRPSRPQLIAPAGAGPGYARSFTMEGSGTRAKVTIRAHRYESVTVAGRPVRALLVQTDIAFTGALEGRQRSLSWFWPKHLLTLKERVDTDVRNGPIRLQSNYEATVKRLP